MNVILDASAMLALLFAERGAESVFPQAKGGLLLSVNFAEVIQRAIQAGGTAEEAESRIDLLEIAVVPFDRALARIAAELRESTSIIGASLADRACLALGLSTGLPILTCDRAWGRLELGLDIRMIR
jgi:PIN domain nuclease of toxin-antitoxin system